MPATRRPVAEPDEEPNRPQAGAHPRAGDHRRPEEGAPTVVAQIYVPIHATAPHAAPHRQPARRSDRPVAGTPRPGPAGAGGGLRPPLVPVAHPRIVRVKTYPLIVCPAQVAAAYMDAMDYDIHLFTDSESGQSAAVHRTGPTGYRLTRLRPTAPPRQTRMPLVTDPRPAPRLTY